MKRTPIPVSEEQLQEALAEHGKLVTGKTPPHHWREPSAHDIYYALDPVTGQRLFYPSGVPAEPGLGEPEPEDIADRVRRQIQGQAILNLARELGADTPEEANDFQVEEGQDICPFSGHEYSEQDEAADAVNLANYNKLMEEKEKADRLEAKRQEYKEMKEAFEPSPPAPGAAAPTSEPPKGD